VEGKEPGVEGTVGPVDIGIQGVFGAVGPTDMAISVSFESEDTRVCLLFLMGVEVGCSWKGEAEVYCMR
jgi:hypothetical protein